MAKAAETLKDRVRRAVESTGMSQTAFAKEARMKLRSLQDILGGRSIDPQMSTLQSISNQSGVSVDELIYGKKKPSAAPKETAPLRGLPELSDFLAKFDSLPVEAQHWIYAFVYRDPELYDIDALEALQSAPKARRAKS